MTKKIIHIINEELFRAHAHAPTRVRNSQSVTYVGWSDGGKGMGTHPITHNW